MRTLERSLLDRAIVLDIGSSLDETTRSVILETRPDLSIADLGAARRLPAAPPPPALVDPLPERRAALESHDRRRERAALEAEPLSPALVARAILLLGWDDVTTAAMKALRRVASSVVGQLTDALLDRTTEFIIRRRYRACSQ